MLWRTTNLTLDQRARETLVRTRRWLTEYGWCKGSMHDGGWCLFGAMTAVWDAEFGEEVLVRAESVLRRVLLVSGESERINHHHMDLTEYNDLTTTVFHDILQLIDDGIGFIDAQMVDPCGCDFAEVVVVVDRVDGGESRH